MGKAQEQTRPGPRTVSERFPMNIDQEIYDAWQAHRRKRDVKTISEKIGWSVPIVERALNFGHVKDPEIIERVTKFFINRNAKEKKNVQTLKQA